MTETVIATSYTDLTPETSLVYKYVYRARNQNGWGDFSEPGYLFAASVPSQSQAPVRVSFSKSHIELELFAPLSTGGDEITSYELWIDGGLLNSEFVKVETYDAKSLSHTLTAVSDSLTVGRIYSIKFRSLN